MPHATSYVKHIACLESLWNNDLEERLSVQPILEVIAKVQDIRLSHLTCNTEPEFHYNLQMLGRRRHNGILYLAFHGQPGDIFLADDTTISIETLAEYMEEKFADWTVHFGSCSTIRVSEKRLAAFVDATQVNMVLGYRKSVDWIESSAMDLLLFQAIQDYVDLRAFWRYIEQNYADLVERTGLAAHFR